MLKFKFDYVNVYCRDNAAKAKGKGATKSTAKNDDVSVTISQRIAFVLSYNPVSKNLNVDFSH